jgi:8-oxo-dGTP diphosphatase
MIPACGDLAGSYLSKGRTVIKCEFENGDKALLRHVCADVLVVKDDQILLVKRTAKLLEGGKWGLVGGFADRDETLAGMVEREVMEETGWKVRDIQLLKVIDEPHRPNDDRQNIVFLYVCMATEKVGETDWESDDQRWFGWSELSRYEEFAFDHLDSIKFYRERVARSHVSDVE